MDQNRPLTPQEREWQREKQLPDDADRDSLDGSVKLTPEDMEKLRRSQGNSQPQISASDTVPEGATIPAIPLDNLRNTPPVPVQPPTPAAELEWHREKQFPQGGQPSPVQPSQAAPEALPTIEALPPVSRPAPPPALGPETMPTRQALPQAQRLQPPPQPTQGPTAPALPNQPRPQTPPGQNPSRPYQPMGQPPGAAGLSPQEQQWQREKQAYGGGTGALTPQEEQWQREKQAYPTDQTRPASASNLTPQERQWQQEKQAYGGGATAPTPQEVEWQREKQNYAGGAAALTPQEQQWQREKQAYSGAGAAPTPALTPQERQWQQEKQGRPVAPVPVPPPVASNNRNTRGVAPAPVPPVPPVPYNRPGGAPRQPERRRGVWLWLLVPLLLLLIGAGVVAFLLLSNPNTPTTPTTTSSVASVTGTPGVTGGSATGTPATKGTPNGTPGVTTGGALNPGQTTTASGSASASAASASASTGTSPSVGTTAAQNEDFYNQGKSAYDSQKWLDAITAWEKVDPNSATFAKTKPLLANAYFNQANDLALKNNTPDSLTQALGFYNKASALLPDNADFRTAAENASFYQSGLKAANGKDWDTAANLFAQLYSRNPDFRDTVQLYYNSLVGQGDSQVGSGNLVAAKDSYSTALGLNFKGNAPDNSPVIAKLADVNAKLNPTATAAPTDTPAPSPSPSATAAPSATALPTATRRPTATPTPKPAPTATAVPLKPCDKGGSGSNFFAFRTGQPPVPNVPDQGRSGVRGVVLSKTGAPLAGASVRIATNGHVFTSVTDGGGNYFREGLGRGVWTISVVAAPNRTICYGAAGQVNLSGQSGFFGSVDFTESVP